jgi:hypothetical protein
MKPHEVAETLVFFGYRFAIVRQAPGLEPRIVLAYRQLEEAREDFTNAQTTYWTTGARFFIRKL